jgi:hypothetical protein
MNREAGNESTLIAVPSEFDPDDLAAELTEAAFRVALRRGVGTDWLDRKLDLWNAMTQTVHSWQEHA